MSSVLGSLDPISGPQAGPGPPPNTPARARRPNEIPIHYSPIRSRYPDAHVFLTEGAIVNDEADPGRPQKTVLREPLTHRVHNVGTPAFEVVDLEFLQRPDGPKAAPIAPPAAENESARVYRWALAPGASTPQHTHERPYLIVAATPMQLLMKSPDGASMEHPTKASDLHWVDSRMTHVLTNRGTEAGVIVEVELK